MSRTDNLFQLVKAMGRADKRNFKLLAQITGGDKKYLRVFDALEKLDSYDENRIKSLVGEENASNQFSVVKNYLYNSILRSLAYFHRSEGEDGAPLALQIKVLQDRNLGVQAMKLLRKAKAEASAQENHTELLSLLAVERESLYESMPVDLPARLAEIHLQEEQALKALELQLEINKVKGRLVDLRAGNRHVRHEGEEAQLRALMQEEWLANWQRIPSARARISLHEVWVLALEFAGDLAGLRLHARAILEGLQANPGLIEALGQAQLTAYFALAMSYMKVEGGAEVSPYVDELRGLHLRSPKLTGIQLEMVLRLESESAIHRDDKPKALEIYKDLHENWDTYSGLFSHAGRLFLTFEAARLAFTLGRFSDALRWINAFFTEPRSEYMLDLQCCARLFNHMIHLEFGNHELVEHQLVATYRFIFKRKRIYNAERAVLRHLKALSESDEALHDRKRWQDMADEVLRLESKPMQRPIVETLMLRAWISKRISTGGNAGDLNHERASESISTQV